MDKMLDTIVEVRELLRFALAEKPAIDDNLGAVSEAYGGTQALVRYAFAKIKQLEADIKAEKANGQ